MILSYLIYCGGKVDNNCDEILIQKYWGNCLNTEAPG